MVLSQLTRAYESAGKQMPRGEEKKADNKRASAYRFAKVTAGSNL
jgi:hypothetical protein